MSGEGDRESGRRGRSHRSHQGGSSPEAGEEQPAIALQIVSRDQDMGRFSFAKLERPGGATGATPGLKTIQTRRLTEFRRLSVKTIQTRRLTEFRRLSVKTIKTRLLTEFRRLLKTIKTRLLTEFTGGGKSFSVRRETDRKSTR